MKRPVEWLSGLAVFLVIAASACANTFDMSIGADCQRGFCDDQVGFGSPDAGVEASLPDSRVLACIGTVCPAPYATCGDVPTAPCSTNLDNDSENCGACGISCGGERLERLRMSSRCSNGVCELECLFHVQDGKLFRDCNNVIDDGCEVNILDDPKNCGACGNVCAAGARCIDGLCGCPPGKLDCDLSCINPQTDDKHCKTCGNPCVPPSVVCSPMPPNTRYGCVEGECGRLKCMPGFADCNGDLEQEGCASNGCETFLLDPNNCGACGIACNSKQECRQVDGQAVCRDVCTKLGLIECEDQCVDPITDPRHCGGCGVRCNRSLMRQLSVCEGGVCQAKCAPGFADCNENPDDGCEVDVRSHPANCGACGVACDQRAGQPCIEGKCLMVECDGGVEAR